MILDGILVLLVVEFLSIAWLLARWGMRSWTLPFLLYLVSGAGLVAALRLHVAGAELPAVAAALQVSLVAHVATLWWLARRAAPGARPRG